MQSLVQGKKHYIGGTIATIMNKRFDLQGKKTLKHNFTKITLTDIWWDNILTKDYNLIAC